MAIHGLFFNEPIEDYYPGHVLGEIYKDNIYAPFLPVKKDNTVALDCGGNLGWTAYKFSQHFGKVYVLEPAMENFTVLAHGIAYNKLTNVIPIQKALDIHNDGTTFYHNKNKTMHSTMPEIDDGSQVPEKVETVTMEQLLKDLKLDHVDFVKLDIEGTEAKVICHPTFKAVADKIDTIVLEVHQWMDRNPQQLKDALTSYGFKLSGMPSSAEILVATRL